MDLLNEFVEWEKQQRDTISHVQGLLSEMLSSEPEVLIAAACTIEGWNGRIGELLANANSWLDRAKMVLRPEKDFGSEMDRRTELDGLVAPVRLLRDHLESLSASIKQRLILAESLLAYQRQFQEHRQKERIL